MAFKVALVGLGMAVAPHAKSLADLRERVEVAYAYSPSAERRGTHPHAATLLLSPTDGFQKKAKIDVEGVRNALKLRSNYAEPRKTLTDPLKYYDDSFYREAMR